MPGSKSDSEPSEPWTGLAVEETGGFAGLRRGVKLTRSATAAAQADRIGRLLAILRADVRAGAVPARPPMPDAQTLALQVQSAAGGWRAAYDTADLPPAASELLRCLPPLRPLPLA